MFARCQNKETFPYKHVSTLNKYDAFTKSSKSLDLSIQIGLKKIINYIVRRVMNVHC